MYVFRTRITVCGALAGSCLNPASPSITHTLALAGVGTTEVFSTRIRAKALALAVSSNRVIAGLMAMGTLPLIDALTTRSVGLLPAWVWGAHL